MSEILQSKYLSYYISKPVREDDMPTLPLEEMSVTEKLQVMEELWSDLCSNQDQIPIPQWHKDTLDRREELVKQGKATFVDWEITKKRIAARIS